MSEQYNHAVKYIHTVGQRHIPYFGWGTVNNEEHQGDGEWGWDGRGGGAGGWARAHTVVRWMAVQSTANESQQSLREVATTGHPRIRPPHPHARATHPL